MTICTCWKTRRLFGRKVHWRNPRLCFRGMLSWSVHATSLWWEEEEILLSKSSFYLFFLEACFECSGSVSKRLVCAAHFLESCSGVFVWARCGSSWMVVQCFRQGCFSVALAFRIGTCVNDTSNDSPWWDDYVLLLSFFSRVETVPSSLVPLIVGASVGGAAGLAIVIVVVVCVVNVARKRKQRRFLRDDEIFASDTESKKLLRSLWRFIFCLIVQDFAGLLQCAPGSLFLAAIWGLWKRSTFLPSDLQGRNTISSAWSASKTRPGH